MITLNGIENGDVQEIGDLTLDAYKSQPQSRDHLALAASEALEIAAATYVLDSVNSHGVDHSPRGIHLHRRSEEIISLIAETGKLPEPKYSFQKGYNENSLHDDEVLLMALFAAINIRNISPTVIIGEVKNWLSEYLSLQNFSIVSWTDILDRETPHEGMASLVDRIITEQKMSRHSKRVHPILKEVRSEFGKRAGTEEVVPALEQHLIQKWNTGHLVVGNLPLQSGRNMSFAAVLPDLVSEKI